MTEIKRLFYDFDDQVWGIDEDGSLIQFHNLRANAVYERCDLDDKQQEAFKELKIELEKQRKQTCL